MGSDSNWCLLYSSVIGRYICLLTNGVGYFMYSFNIFRLFFRMIVCNGQSTGVFEATTLPNVS